MVNETTIVNNILGRDTEEKWFCMDCNQFVKNPTQHNKKGHSVYLRGIGEYSRKVKL